MRRALLTAAGKPPLLVGNAPGSTGTDWGTTFSNFLTIAGEVAAPKAGTIKSAKVRGALAGSIRVVTGYFSSANLFTISGITSALDMVAGLNEFTGLNLSIPVNGLIAVWYPGPNTGLQTQTQSGATTWYQSGISLPSVGFTYNMVSYAGEALQLQGVGS